jgi:hypothetical protein
VKKIDGFSMKKPNPIFITAIVVTAVIYGSWHLAGRIVSGIVAVSDAVHNATAPGPVEPVPSIEDHTAAVMAWEHPECLTWTSLQHDYSVRFLCKEMLERHGTGIPTNPWNVTTYAPCSRIDAIEVDGVRVWQRKGSDD